MAARTVAHIVSSVKDVSVASGSRAADERAKAEAADLLAALGAIRRVARRAVRLSPDAEALPPARSELLRLAARRPGISVAEAAQELRLAPNSDDDRVSLTIDHDAAQIMEITGLSMAGHAQAVVDRAEAEKVLHMLPLKYPEQKALPGPMPTAEQVRIFRVVPIVISVLDYSKGFGHTDLIT